jgi:hypothetical protein
MERFIIILILSIFLNGCKKQVPDNCDGEYSLKTSYSTSHPTGRVAIGEEIKIEVKIPANIYNYSSDSIVNISRFNKILLGIVIYELLMDSTQNFGIRFNSINDGFLHYSPNVKLDFTPMQIGTNRVRFYLRKEADYFKATILMRPNRKGVFYIGLLDGFIEDAFCKADIYCNWGNFSPFENVENLLSFNKIEIPDELKQVWITDDDKGYFLLVE